MKGGRIRCGRCERILRDQFARRGFDPAETARARELRSRPAGASWTHDELVDTLNLATGRNRQLVEAGEVQDRDGRRVLTLTCRCATRWALDLEEAQARSVRAHNKGQDVILTDADLDRWSGASGR